MACLPLVPRLCFGLHKFSLVQGDYVVKSSQQGHTVSLFHSLCLEKSECKLAVM